MRVLVTGHEGYIGRVLVRQLKEAGHVVVGLDCGFFRDGVMGSFFATPDLVLCKDIRHIEITDLDGVAGVIHLAGLSDDPTGELDANLTDRINRRATTRLARLARDAGVEHFLFSSSTSVFGLTEPGVTVDEESPATPITAYAKSKLDAEGELISLASDTFRPVCLRLATAYGHAPSIRFCTLVVHNFMGHALSTGKILIRSDGTPWRPLIHVEDICDAFLAVLHAPADDLKSRIYNVGRDDQNFQVRDIAEAVRAAVPGSEIEFASEQSVDRRSYRVSFARIKRDVSAFRPKWSLLEGCVALHRFLRDNGFSRTCFEDRRFSRLKKLQYLMTRQTVDADLFWRD